jgi:hypothetical protein
LPEIREVSRMSFIPTERIKEEQRRDPEFVRAYEALAEEFQIAETLLLARPGPSRDDADPGRAGERDQPGESSSRTRG